MTQTIFQENKRKYQFFSFIAVLVSNIFLFFIIKFSNHQNDYIVPVDQITPNHVRFEIQAFVKFDPKSIQKQPFIDLLDENKNIILKNTKFIKIKKRDNEKDFHKIVIDLNKKQLNKFISANYKTIEILPSNKFIPQKSQRIKNYEVVL